MTFISLVGRLLLVLLYLVSYFVSSSFKIVENVKQKISDEYDE